LLTDPSRRRGDTARDLACFNVSRAFSIFFRRGDGPRGSRVGERVGSRMVRRILSGLVVLVAPNPPGATKVVASAAATGGSSGGGRGGKPVAVGCNSSAKSPLNKTLKRAVKPPKTMIVLVVL
jgi:hypothetical protein